MDNDQNNGTRTLAMNDMPRELFFRLQAMKAKLQCDTWQDFVVALVENGDAIVAAVERMRGEAVAASNTAPRDSTQR